MALCSAPLSCYHHFSSSDIGEHSYAPVLVDDILGRGTTDLLLSTFGGNVICFSTEVRVPSLSTLMTQNAKYYAPHAYTIIFSFCPFLLSPSFPPFPLTSLHIIQQNRGIRMSLALMVSLLVFKA